MISVKEYINKVCYLEIDNPDKKNALCKSTIQQLISFFQSSSASTKFNVLVLSGSNGFFSAGADLAWMKEGINQTYKENNEDAQLFNELYHAMSNFAKPIIAKVDGGAFGGAIGLLACADVVITSPKARFKFSETALGLVPATVAPYIIKKIGEGNARYLLLTGSLFTGEDALTYGLAHQLVSANELANTTRQIAEHMAALGPQATVKTKEMLNSLGHHSFSVTKETKNYCATLIATARKSKESQERVAAFFNKKEQSNND